MIRRRTVLILGAGASQPYRFPIGSELVDQICSEILDAPGRTGLITRLEDQYVASAGDAARFAEALRGARTYSIDAFLETKRRFRELGKAAIADVLLRAEIPKWLDNADVKRDWYRYLFSILVQRNPEHFRAQARCLTIITFNFDRSFERALFSALRHSFEITAEQARSLAMELDIHHVHGRLGEPDWLYPDHPDGNPYGVHGDIALVAAVAKAVPKVKIVDDEIPSSMIEDLQVPIQKAAFVYFIGFGFDERNLERLGGPGILPTSCVVRGTCLGKTAGEQQPILRHFGDMKIHLYESDDALTFLSSRAEALFD